MSRFLRLTTLWLWGGFVYYLIELAWRGRSHPSMFIVGGVCLLLLGGVNKWFPWSLGLVWQALIGAAVITAVEFAAGVVVNLWLGLNVWDYGELPLNLLGQVCLWFFFAWIPVAAFGIWLDDWLWHMLFGDEKPHYKLF